MRRVKFLFIEREMITFSRDEFDSIGFLVMSIKNLLDLRQALLYSIYILDIEC